jgi:RimJ/RimL family protein N-acetyltransferase
MQTTNDLGQPIGSPLPDWAKPARPSREPMAGRFCRLVAMDPDAHAQPLFEANQSDTAGGMWTYLPYGPFASLSSYRAWMAGLSKGEDPVFYTILAGAAARPVGLSAYLRIDANNGSIEVGHLAYAPLLQRTPAATEAMYLMMRHAFELGYRRYEWKCNDLNRPSRVAAERLGFTFEGVFRQAAVVKGHNRDTAWYSIIDGEWPMLRSAFELWLDPANFDPAGRQRQRLATFIAHARAGLRR